MLNLQTRVNIPNPSFSIDYTNKIALLGSCFATNIGNKFSRFKFQSVANPFGVLYNPASIAQGIELLLNKNEFTADSLNYHNQLWYSFLHHSSFSNSNKEKCLININEQFLIAKSQFKKSNTVILTLGTSWIYRLKKNNMVVANCHKLPANDFIREFLESDESFQLLSSINKQLLSINPEINLILTISPIRHMKDGAVENTRSKAALIMAIKKLQEQFSNCFYFPVYEIFMDELRDYRFYAADMIHPSDFSIDYIWEVFMTTFLSKTTLEQTKKVEKLVKSYEHKPSDKASASYKKFAQKLLTNTQSLEKDIPTIDFSQEKEQIKYFV